MGSYLLPATSGAAQNLNASYESAGFVTAGVTAGAMTPIPISGTANTKGAWVELHSGIDAAGWAGFYLFLNIANLSGNRYLVDIGTGVAASEVVRMPDVYSAPGTVVAGPQVVYVPLNIAAGARVAARMQCSAIAGALTGAILGVIRNATSPPLWNNCERFTTTPAGSPAATFPSDTDVTATVVAGTGWTVMKASTARTYGAIMPSMSVQKSGTVPTTAQPVTLRTAVGATLSEVLIGAQPEYVSSSAPAVNRFNGLPLLHSVPSTSQINCEILTGVAGLNDKFCVSYHGFY